MKLRTKYKKLKQRYEFIKNVYVPPEVLVVPKPVIKLKAAVTCDEYYYHEPWMYDELKRELATQIIKQLLESDELKVVTRFDPTVRRFICEATLMIVGAGNE